jgi:uncharacterized membrane protein YdjX (TVP38/TMEM64 family)
MAKTTCPVAEERKKSARKKTWLWTVPLVIVVVLVLFKLRTQIGPALDALEVLVHEAGVFGPVLLVFATGVWLTLVLPGPMILGLSATVFAHNPVLAIAVSSLGLALAQAAAFILARFFMRDAVLNKIGQQPWFRKLDQKVEEKGSKGVFVIRMIPFFPNTLANYGFGLTKISFWPYLLASWAGTLPLITVFILGATGFIHVLKDH